MQKNRPEYFFRPYFVSRPKLFWINILYSDQNFHHYNLNQTLHVLEFGIWDLGIEIEYLEFGIWDWGLRIWDLGPRLLLTN